MELIVFLGGFMKVDSLIVLINNKFARVLSVSSHLFLLTYYTAHLHYISFSLSFFFKRR